MKKTATRFPRKLLVALLPPLLAADCGGDADGLDAQHRSVAEEPDRIVAGEPDYEVAITTGGIGDAARITHGMHFRTIIFDRSRPFASLSAWIRARSNSDGLVTFSVNGDTIRRFPTPRMLKDGDHGDWFSRVGQLVGHIERDSEVRRALLAADGDRAAVRDNFVREFGEEGFADLTEIAGGERAFHDLAESMAASFRRPSQDAGEAPVGAEGDSRLETRSIAAGRPG